MLSMFNLDFSGFKHQHKIIEALLSEEIVVEKVITEANINVEDISF